MFNTYAGSTGASVTLTGLAVTDIEIYKDGSVTQRASDAGYVLLDTDGIDFDAITGIHGFSIDTGDNTDASFYTVGAWFTVVVSAVTVDSQTVNFIACQFRLMAAEGIAAKPKVDVDAWLGTAAATPTVAGVPEVDLTHVSGATTNVSALATNVDAILTDTGTTLDARIPAALVGGRMDANVGAISSDATAADNAEAFFDGTGYAGTNNVIPTVTTTTTATNVTTVNGLAANVITAAATAADFGTEVAAAVWNADATSYQTQGTFGQAIGDPVADTNTIYKAVVTDATGATVGVDVVAMKVDTAAILVDTDVIGATGGGLTSLATQASVNTIDDFLDTEIAAIKTVTDAIGATGTGLSAIPWNAAWDAEVQSECTDALNAYDPPTNSEMEARTPTAAQLVYIVSNSADGVPVTFSGGTTTTAVLVNVDGAAASSVDDFYNGRVLVFNASTLDMQVTDITDYVGSTKTATITAVTTAVTSAHTANMK